MDWAKKHIISINDFTRAEIDFVLEKSEVMEGLLEDNLTSHLLENKILGLLFFEPSTRTKLSFETAMKRLGGQTIGFDSAEASSSTKGETIADCLRIAAGYADIVVLRHPLDGSARHASEFLDKPLINAGDGSNQHPTQTLLDLYTLKKRFGKIDGLKIAFLGDLKYGRTVHSLANALEKYDVSLKLISPDNLKMPDAQKKSLTSAKIKFKETPKLDFDDCDVIYATRIQKERFPDPLEYEKVKDAFILDKQNTQKIKKDAILLHPLPRVNEISPELDSAPFAHYFIQAKNGIPVRMTILCLVSQVKFW
ncbi:MAG: aspartate carbamoyltransferase [Candidatus Altiarchaeota archaeon]